MELRLINQSRKAWIDALRAIAIIFVIYGHSVKTLPAFFIITSPIKMPLFFAVSGYLLRPNKEWIKFFDSLIKRVIVPWFVLGLVVEVLRVPNRGIGYLLDYFLKMLSGEVLWFMPCFVLAEILFFCIIKILKRPYRIFIASFISSLLGLWLSSMDLLDYAMINRSLVVQVFFFLGYYFHEKESFFTSIRWWWLACAALLYFALCIVSMYVFPGKILDVHLNRYYNIPFCFLLISIGCLSLFSIFSRGEVRLPLLSFIGQNTLILYIWHGYAFLVFGTIIGWDYPNSWWLALLRLIWACVFCGLFAVLFNKYLPAFVGKK